MSIWRNCTLKLHVGLDGGFYNWGRFVARRPWIVIVTSILVTCICSIGLINLKFETDANKMWIHNDSKYKINTKWISENFPQDKRVQTIMFRSESSANILSPESLKFMMKMHKKISELRPQNVSFPDICHR